MSLVNNIGAAFIEAAEQAGVDPITFLQNMTQSGDKPVIVEKANDKADGVEKVSKRKYNRVVPEGSLRDLEVGTFGTDSLGRLHQVVEHRAFADKTRKAGSSPMFRSRWSALFLPAKSLTLRWMPRSLLPFPQSRSIRMPRLLTASQTPSPAVPTTVLSRISLSPMSRRARSRRTPSGARTLLPGLMSGEVALG